MCCFFVNDFSVDKDSIQMFDLRLQKDILSDFGILELLENDWFEEIGVYSWKGIRILVRFDQFEVFFDIR